MRCAWVRSPRAAAGGTTPPHRPGGRGDRLSHRATRETRACRLRIMRAMLLKWWRRKRLREREFPAAWRAILDRGFPYYRCLPPQDRKELEGHIQVFLAEKYFE